MGRGERGGKEGGKMPRPTSPLRAEGKKGTGGKEGKKGEEGKEEDVFVFYTYKFSSRYDAEGKKKRARKGRKGSQSLLLLAPEFGATSPEKGNHEKREKKRKRRGFYFPSLSRFRGGVRGG